MIKVIAILGFITTPAFAQDLLLSQLDQKAKDLAALDGLQASADRMTGAAFHFGYVCGAQGNTWQQCQKLFVDTVK
jgi:hypothetical protein